MNASAKVLWTVGDPQVLTMNRLDDGFKVRAPRTTCRRNC